MRWKMDRRIVFLGFALAVASSIFAGYESYRNTVRFSEASEWRRHTYEVLRNIDATAAGLVDAETGQRGYLLTGQESYLEPYRAAIQNVGQTMGNLSSLTSDNPNEQKRIQILRPLVGKKLGELQRTIDLRGKEGLASASKVVLEGSGKRWMDQIRALLAEMKNEEEALLQARTLQTSRGVARSVRTVYAGTLLSISLLAVCFLLLTRELFERKKAQDALEKSEKWFSTTLSSIGDAVIATDMNGGVTFLNAVAQSLTGWNLEDARGRSMDLVFNIVNKETRRPVENPVKKVFREGKIVGLADHTILRSRNGKEFDIEDSAAPILTDSGEAFGVVLVFRDITDKKLAEEETRRQKDLLQLILASVADGVVVADTNGKFLVFNAAAERFIGIGAIDASPDQWSQQYGSFLPDGFTLFPGNELPLVRAMRGENVDDVELLIRNSNVPEGRLLSITGRPLRGQDGSVKGGVVVFHDITERKKAEEALRLSEERFRLLVSEVMDYAILMLDPEGRIASWNAGAERIKGYKRDEIMGQHFSRFYPAEDVKQGKPAHELKVATEQGRFEDEGWRLRKDGSRFWANVVITALRDSTGRLRGFGKVTRDFTERKRAEETLRQSQERYHLLFDSIPHPVWVYDLKTLAILDVNHSAVRNYGYSREEFLSLTIKDIRPPEDIPALLESAEKAPPDSESNSVWKHRKKDGSLIDVEITSHPLNYRGGDARLVVATDITTRKQAEEALQNNEEKFRSVVQTANDAIVTADSHGNITDFNRGAEATFGYSAREVIGQPLAVLMPDRFKENHQQGLKRYLETREAHVIGKTVELAARRKDKTEFPVELSLSSWKTRAGLFFTGVISDITERKRAEELMLQAKEQAERTSKFKDQFLSTMSHELRTPLNAVLGFSDLLADERYGPLNEKQRRYIDHIHTGGKHLLALISDILDLSKIEAGRMELTFENLSVQGAFGEVLSAMQPLADKKSHTLSTSAESKLAVRADATRFRQVLLNLLGNAIKFTPNGGRIALAARLEDGSVRVEVRDNGPGIPDEEKTRIFEAFYRLRDSGKKAEGTGLGLAITQRLVELHGGKLGLDSQAGRGSCFYFSLPAAVPVQEASGHRAEAPSGALGQRRILVIEDDRTTAHLIHSQLTSAGYQVTLCEEPQNTLEIAAQLQPDAITLDIVMKPKNGWEILILLKRDPRTAQIPLIVVSIVDQPTMGALLGADEYLVKPVDKQTLLSAIARHVRSHSKAKPGRPILVVEDDAPTREFIAEMLSNHGFAVITAADGAQARAQVASSLPKLVILDMMLPKVSGFELLGEWRSSVRTAGLPVFVLTSKDLTHDEQLYLHTHAEALLRKQEPWHDALVKQIERVLSPSMPENV